MTKKSKHLPSHQNLLERYQKLGQLCEVLAVIALALALLIGMVDYHNPWWKILAVLPLVGFLPALLGALHFGGAAEKQGQRVVMSTKHVISQRRLSTLRIVNAPQDAVDVLEEIFKEMFKDCSSDQQYTVTEKDLITRLVRALGSERTAEIKAVILKYTKIDERDRSDNSTKKSSESKPEINSKPKVLASTS